MKLRIDHPSENALNLMRRLGYAFQHQEGEEASYIRVLASAGYPRFHSYVKTRGFAIEISIHLDQKKHTHGEDTRHHGEYENDGALKPEVERIIALSGAKIV